jgi:DNA-directed RNA polymerase subunit beta'
MKLELLNINDFCEDLPKVTTHKIYKRNKFHSDGIFSNVIFGPTNDFTCDCGHQGHIGETCPKCDVKWISSYNRKISWGAIELPFEIINPAIYMIIKYKYLKALKKFNKWKKFVIDKEGNFIEDDEHGYFYGIKYLKAYIFTSIKEKIDKEQPLSYEENIIWNNKDKFTIKYIPVIPPELRPIIMLDTIIMDNINNNYLVILNKIEHYNKIVINIDDMADVFKNIFLFVQKQANEIFDTISDKLQKKEGLIRHNIMGKRVDFSARSVIIVDPKIPVTHAAIPYILLLELYKPFLAKKLVKEGRFYIFMDAVEYIDELIEKENYELFDFVKSEVTNKFCILNRQPTLHRGSMFSFKIIVNKEKTIKINPLICVPYNADFDGDQMAIYMPITPEATDEIKNKIYVGENNIMDASLNLNFVHEHDIVLGIYILTHDKESAENDNLSIYEKEIVKGIETTKGRKIFNDIINLDEFINYNVKENDLLDIMKKCYYLHSKEEYLIIVDRIKTLGFYYASHYPKTISLKRFIENKLTREEKEKNIYKKPINDDLKEYQPFENYLRESIYLKHAPFAYKYFIESGARGSIDQAKQMYLAKGHLANSKNKIIPYPIINSLVDGLTSFEYFLSCYGARKGIADVADKTAISGYLTRQLIYAASSVVVNDEDCGTIEYFKIELTKENWYRFDQRYILDEDKNEEILLTYENKNNYVGKKIKVRSPIYCKSKTGVCKKCAGDIYKKLHSKYLGIIAAQTLGERSTQLILRTFHISGAISMDNKEIPDDILIKIYSEIFGENGLTYYNKDENKNISDKEYNELLEKKSLTLPEYYKEKFENEGGLGENKDITYNLKTVIHLLRSKIENRNMSSNELYDTILNAYKKHRILSLWYEIIISQLFWVENPDGTFDKLRLVRDKIKDKQNLNVKKVSIDFIPSLENWFLAIMYSSFKKNVIRGLNSDNYDDNIFVDIMTGNI